MAFRLSVCALLLAAAVGERVPAAEPAPRDLRLFYQQNCVRCHGADGTASDAQGKSLSGQDFTDARWRTDSEDADLVKTIQKGKFFGWAMPAYKSQLTPEESLRLVTEILRQATRGKTIAPDVKVPDDKQP